MVVSGCSTSPDTVSSIGSSPAVESVQTIKNINGNSIATSSFRVGEMGNFIIIAVDPDKDIETLYLKGFAPGNLGSQPTFESGAIELKPQTKKIESYSLPEPVEVPSPPGRWRVDIQVEDKKKNMSNVYILYTIVH
ncbi:MAG: hypothetical protein JRI91_05060 [Deltaproteobacteria bacterium]|nr:hypothetical protein [Deltaproteobacteria bacterium]